MATGNGETILLVDDEETLVRLGEEMIASLGYEPVGFTSSIAALAGVPRGSGALRSGAVGRDDARHDGLAACRAIIQIRADVPIVLMSGYAGASLAARARSAGARDVLGKPLALRDIANVLASVVGQRSQRF